MLTKMDLRQLHIGLKEKRFSSLEVTQAYLAKIEDDPYNAFILKTSEFALDAARAADKKISAGGGFGLMTGIPFGAKDIFCTKGIRTTACSDMLKNFIPNYESTVTSKMHEAGAVMLGKLNMDEFAMGSANINSCFGAVINPNRGIDNAETDLIAGGSSGGSAAAVAGDLCPCSLGSDTGGSVRQPAALCGIVGVKPTYGRCSRWGMIAFASSLDQAGVMAKTVEDASIVLGTICGHDPMDSTSSDLEAPKFNFSDNSKGISIGIPRNKNLHSEHLPKEIQEQWITGAKKMERDGAKIVEIDLPDLHYSLPAYYVLSSAEAAANLARYDGLRYGQNISGSKSVGEDVKLTRSTFMGDEVKRRILTGNYILSYGYEREYYKRAQRVRKMLKKGYLEAFKKVDVILTPTTPCDAFAVNQKIDPVMMYLNDIFTVSINLAGLPAVSVPFGKSSNGLPLGLQIVGQYYKEAEMMNVARLLENQS